MKRLIICLVLALCSSVCLAQSSQYSGIWRSDDGESHLILHAGVAIIVAEEEVKKSGPYQYVFFQDKPHQLSIRWGDEHWVTYLVRFPSSNVMELQANDRDPSEPANEFSDPARFTRAE